MQNVYKSILNKKLKIPNLGGISIFIVMGFGMLITIATAVLIMRSQNQNTLSKRITLNEEALLHARSAINIINSGLNNSLDAINDAQSFYTFMTKDHAKHFTKSSLQLDEETLISFLSKEDGLTYTKFKKSILPAQISIQAALTIRGLNEANILQDPVEKIVELTLLSIAKSYGLPVKYSRTKEIVVYNLLPPLTSKFTFYHKTPIKSNYNRFSTNNLGFPKALPGLPDSRPLILFNRPIKKSDEVIKTWMALTNRPLDNNSSQEDSLPTFLSRDSLENLNQGGYLYFGNSVQTDFGSDNYDSCDMNVIKLTAGKNPKGYGELSQLYPVELLDQAPQAILLDENQHPQGLRESYITSNYFEDGTIIKTQSKAFIHHLTDGFYDEDEFRDYFPPKQDGSARCDGVISTQIEHSSLIHPFGTNQIPSPAYTVGKTYRSWMRFAWLELDRMEEDLDEKILTERLKLSEFASKMNTRIANLRSLNREDFNDRRDLILSKFNPVLSNTWYLDGSTDDIEPIKLRLTDDFNVDRLFSGYQEYNFIQSKPVQLPMNQFLRLSSQLNSGGTVGSRENFKQTEEWIATWGSYLNGNDADFNPDEWQRERLVHWYNSVNQLRSKKILTQQDSFYVLNLPSHAVGLRDNLILDKPLKILGPMNLYVDGSCHFAGVQSEFLTSFNCNSITFSGKPNEPYEVSIYDGFYSSRGTIKKGNLMTPLIIMGGLATERIDPNFFGMVSAVIYNSDLNPLSTNYVSYYRARMMPTYISWGQL